MKPRCEQEPDADYRSAPGLNWSTLKAMATSPKHYRWLRDNPRSDSAAFRLGRATHAAILEPERFEDAWTVYPGRRAGKAWQAFQEDNLGREIVSQAEYDQAVAMATAVTRSPALAERLNDGRAEVSLYWSEPVDGMAEPVAMRARLDWLYKAQDGAWVVLDVKTAREIGRTFGTAAARFLYHGQLAHYCAGVAAVLGGQVRAELLVVETQGPYDCGLLQLDQVALECGRKRRRDLLARLAQCTNDDDWPGQIPTPGWLQLPDWELATLDDLEA